MSANYLNLVRDEASDGPAGFVDQPTPGDPLGTTLKSRYEITLQAF